MKSNKPHIYFWIAAAIIFIIGLFYFNSDEAVGINIYDTYYVIATFYLVVIILIFFSFTGLVYYIHSKFEIPLIGPLTIIHSVTTIG